MKKAWKLIPEDHKSPSLQTRVERTDLRTEIY